MKLSNKSNSTNPTKLSCRTSIPGQIKRQSKRLKQLQQHLAEANQNNHRYIKKLELSILMQNKKLSKLKRDLDEIEQHAQVIVISERLEMMFTVAKALRPRLSEEMQKLLMK